ncbi:MAG: class I SAM-dependent methyltransferase [Mycobacterium sp.]
MVLSDITAKYAPVESWFYDTLIAGGVLESVSGLIDLVGKTASQGSVLEVGCGGGQFACRLVEQYPNLRASGVDLSAEQVKRATKRARTVPSALRGQLQFHVASALDLPFPDNTFDAVISIASIKHWPDRALGVAEMTRVLKNNGLLLVAEVDRSCHLDDARAFVQTVRLAAPLRLPYLWGFHTYIAGQGLDLDDGRAALADLPLAETAVKRIPGTPFMMLTGIKTP